MHPILDALATLSALASIWGGDALNCGFNGPSCQKDDPSSVMVGVWLCEDLDPANCKCGPGGCKDAQAFRTYALAVDGSDSYCDTLGGWREDDLGFGGAFGKEFGSVHFQVHPDDMDKIDQYDVKLRLHEGDYCTGVPAGPTNAAFEAWDESTNLPGDWSLADTYAIKSLRPYVDLQRAPTPGIGIKFVAWPNGHMGRPYDEITCVDDGSGSEWTDNSAGYCASAFDRIYCIEPDNSPGLDEQWGVNDNMGNGVDWGGADFAGDLEGPKWWIQQAGGVPMGSLMYGVYTNDGKYECDTDWVDFCAGTTSFGASSDYCLVARFMGEFEATDDWDEAEQQMSAEAWINMDRLCDNYGTRGFCLNVADGSADHEAGICLNNVLRDAQGDVVNPGEGQPTGPWPLYVDQVWTRILYAPGQC